jgi:hypothetical protein
VLESGVHDSSNSCSTLHCCCTSCLDEQMQNFTGESHVHDSDCKQAPANASAISATEVLTLLMGPLQLPGS